MPIDRALLDQVQWDEPEPAGDNAPLTIDVVGGISESDLAARNAAAPEKIDLSAVVWDDTPNTPQSIPNPPESSANPTEGMSNYDRFLAGVGKSFVDTGYGLAQAAGDITLRPANAALSLLRPLSPENFDQVSNTLNSPLNRLREIQAERAQLDAPLMDTGAGLAGNITGAASQILLPGIAARGTQLGSALLPTTVRGNALQGLGLGALQPYASDAERAQNAGLGAAAGGIGAGIGNALGRLGNSALATLARTSPAEQRAGQIIMREATNPDAINFQPSQVPGVNRTAGEASLDPGIMALEDQVRSARGDMFRGIDSENNARRVESLQGIAGTDSDMAAAVAARGQAASDARREAMEAGPVDISRTILALDDAIASQQGRPAVQSGLIQVRRLLENEVESAPGLATSSPENRIAVLDNVRKTIGDMLSGQYGADTARALQGSRELIGIRDALNAEIGDQVPAFTTYLNAYRQGSGPINRMQVGREVLNRGSGQIPDAVQGQLPEVLGDRVLQPNAFSRTVNNLDTIAQRATGFAKARAEDILSADDMRAIRAVQDDLTRQAARSRSAAGGSQTAGRQSIAERTLRQSVAGRIPFAGPIFEAVGNHLRDATQERLAYLLANPREAERVLASMNRADAQVLRTTLGQLAIASERPVDVSGNNRIEQQPNQAAIRQPATQP